MFFVATKRVTLKVMAFKHCIYTCFVCLCVGRKGTYKRMWNRESNQKSGLHSHCAANKNVTRLGAAEVPADRETSLSLSFEPLRGPPLWMFSFIIPHVGYMVLFSLSFCQAHSCPSYQYQLKVWHRERAEAQYIELSLHMRGPQKCLELAPFLIQVHWSCLYEK